MADERFAPFYDRGFAERVFTVAEIERQGRYLLYRALNIGRAIAFVGSGVSAGYGHSLWSELLDEAKERIEGHCKDAFSSPTGREFDLISAPVAGPSEPDMQPLRAYVLEVVANDPRLVKSAIVEGIHNTKTDKADPDSNAYDLAVEALNACGGRHRPSTKPRPSAPMLPAHALFARLGVKRVVTTNYDSVLEDTLQKMGYIWSDHAGVRIGERTTKEQARAAVLSPGTTATLIDFAVRGSPFEHEVFHLHGSADKDKADSLVVTERDYQRAYFRNTPERFVLEEALSVVFAGNPIIFVGMGMAEADLLRPLRRFVSNPELRINHNIVALLPAEQCRARRAFTALNLHLRYGVHVIFYGQDELGDLSDPDAFNPAPWAPDSPAAPENAWLYRSIARISSLCDALNTNLPRLQSHKSSNPEFNHLEPVFDAAKKLQNGELEAALQLVRRALNIALTKTAPLIGLESLTDALRAIDRAIRTHALTQALATLADDRDKWWESWQRLPAPRRYIHGIQKFNGATWEALPRESAPPSNLAFRHAEPLRAVRFATQNIASDKRILDIADRIQRKLQEPACEAARIIIAHGGVGSGRGSLFGLLQEKLTTECQWQLFINASYSMEYSSVVDGLTDFIWRLTTKVPDPPFQGQAKPRREAIESYLRKLSELTGKRLLVVLHGVELLFHSDGRPKNEEVVAALRQFLSHPAADLVFLAQTDRARAIFGKGFPGEPSSLLLGQPDRLTQKEVDKIGEVRHATAPEPSVHFAATCFALPALSREHFEEWCADELARAAPGREVTEEFLYNLREMRFWKTWPQDRFSASCVLRAFWQTFDLPDGGPAAMRSFDAAVCDIHTRASDDRHEDQILLQIIEHYRSLKLADWGLCEEILTHLSIISAPVEASVLARCPDVVKALAREPGEHNGRIERACERLVELGLIYQIGTRPLVGAESGMARYAPHKSFQSLFYRKIGSPHLAFGDSRLFTVSLYPSHRVDLPAPTTKAFKFLVELVNALSGRNQAPAAASRNEEDRANDVRCLRAALSLVRSALSFAVVCRLGTVADPIQRDQMHGRLEYVRLLLRWLIFRAGMLGDEATVEAPASGGSKRCSAKHRRWRLNALYQDEITWLYNECGIVSLSQGNMYDAWALLRQARISNRKVEGHLNNGPNALRIQMNLALTEIIRGNLARADDLINQVRHATHNNNRLLYAVATGYHGLVAHMRGRFDQAGRLYKRGIALARGISGEGRLLSILHRHHGELLRDAGLFDQAREELRAARAEAETSRQQDQAHKTLVAQARLEIDAGALERGKSREVLRMIMQAEKYAEDMELHSLKVEAAAARSLVFERQGESRLSGDAAIAGLSIATQYGMRLRVMTALCRVGRAANARGYREQAEIILNTALRMSERAGYQLCSEQARQALNQLESPA